MDKILKKAPIAQKVSIIGTFRAIEKGSSVKFDCRTLGSYYSAASACTRLNQAAKRKEFSVVTEDNGATYTVTRTA